jgi:hypothetical protein
MKNIKYLLLLLPAILFSQAPRGFYLMAGANSTTLKSDDILSDSGIGYKAGLNFNFGYHETYNYQIETLYNLSSIKIKTTDNSFQNVEDSKYNYPTIDLGFYFNYYVLKPDEDKFFLGPQLGVSFSFAGVLTPNGKRDVTEELYLPYLINENDLTYTPKANSFAGFGLTGGYNDFRFDLRYSLGLNNFLKEVEINSYDEFNRYTGPTLNGKLNTISFTISYRINKLFGAE